MRTIHKVKLKVQDIQIVALPLSAEPLSIQVQEGEIVMWYLCNDSYVLEKKEIRCYGTGHPVYNNAGDYIGTVQLNGLVWHFFS